MHIIRGLKSRKRDEEALKISPSSLSLFLSLDFLQLQEFIFFPYSASCLQDLSETAINITLT